MNFLLGAIAIGRSTGRPCSSFNPMHPYARPAEVLFFHCGECGTELSVPVALQGIEGPCPCCGQGIKAPECFLPVPPPAVYLPPLDRRHEPASVLTESIPVPVWMHEAAPEALKVDPIPVAAEAILEDPAAPRAQLPGLVPRWMSGREGPGFQARLAIPAGEEVLEDLPEGEGPRRATLMKLDAPVSRRIESTGFRIARVAMLVVTGGMGAGVILYIKERNWVLDLPWRPAAVETVVEVPVIAPAMAPRAAEPVNPFLAEDPSEMEAFSPPQAMVPDPVSVPVGASPIAGGKK